MIHPPPKIFLAKAPELKQKSKKIFTPLSPVFTGPKKKSVNFFTFLLVRTR